MKALAILLFVVFYAAAAINPRGVQASPLRIPTTLYPPGAHITYRPVLSNAEMDCLWGFFCEGNVPLFHSQTQDQFHRVAGWGQFAGVERHGRMMMAFQLFVSHYDPVPDETGTCWSKRAFLDLRMAIHIQGYALDRRDVAQLLTLRGGQGLIAVQQLGPQDLVVMAMWSRTLEIEGIALYEHRLAAARQTAWASLARQMHLASTHSA